MQYISSDTNIWVDFAIIQRMELPCRLPYTYIMYKEAIEDELLSPEVKLAVSLGLRSVDISSEEFFLAEQYGVKYKRLSVYDRIALAIAKNRSITLLSGDGALRKAATQEQVEILGTLGVLDQLVDLGRISEMEYDYCLNELLQFNGGAIRLPASEIIKRLNRLSESEQGSVGNLN